MIRVTIAAIIGCAVSFVAYSIYADVDASGAREATLLPCLELSIALLIALGFAFVNGFQARTIGRH
jgi:PiT family inorganic phosphate transporter